MTTQRNNAKRATDASSKKVRRQTILNAAMSLFRNDPQNLPTVQLIAKESELAKGTVYLYFSTKEEIFLALLETQYELLFSTLEKLLQKATNDYDEIEVLIDQITEFVARNPDWLTLVSLSNNIIEQNIDFESISKHKQFLIGKVISIGNMIDNKFTFIDEGLGAKLIWRSYALMIGLYQATTPSPGLSSLYQSAELSIMTPDFNSEIGPLLKSLWKGCRRID